MAIPAAQRKRSPLGMVIGALVVLAIGAGGYLALGRKPAAPPPAPQASQPPAPPPVAVVHDTVRVAATPPPAPARRQSAPPAAPAAQGFITVNSEPPGTVFIDGRDVGSVPVIEEPVSVGRHTIRVERPGFKTKTETIDVPANNPVRRRYVLDPEG